ncbi:hypothetical protein [Paraburkholderia sp. MM6662-R1]|uniref:hypothetical protein n=1 Tax=Paraburkholderia sp. MM6662-R1 TaxID=2991066 RepID=UPI003D1C7F87
MYDIKTGLIPDDQKADALGYALLSAVAVDDRRNAERLLLASEQRASLLPVDVMRFLATAEYVAGTLLSDPQLEWSPPVIGLCKAVEAEIVARILRPLAMRVPAKELADDRADKDVGRIASFSADQTRKPPELGVFAHFLQTAIHSQHRRENSVLIRSFLELLREWAGSSWLLDPNGLHHQLVLLTTNFRNRAAHIDELSKADYDDCRVLVIGTNGLLWTLLTATEERRR